MLRMTSMPSYSKAAGLNVESAAKRGVYTLHESLVIKSVGKLSDADAQRLNQSLLDWLELG